MAKEKNRVCDAVKLLRLALQESQPDFAKRLNTALRTVARYESTRPPKGKVLAHLEQIALQNGFDEYAQVFRNALAEELGMPAQAVPVREPKPGRAVPDLDYMNDEERLWCGALLLVLRDEQYADQAKRIQRTLKSARDEVARRVGAVDQVLRIVAAYGRLRNEGKSHQEIAAMLNIQEETLQLLVSSYHPQFGLNPPEAATRATWAAVASAIAVGASAAAAGEQFNMPEYVSLALEKVLKEVKVPMVPFGKREAGK